MKTSNKLLLAALIVLLSSLAVYNIALKAELNTGSYKDPYRDYTAIKLGNFDEVNINPGTSLNVLIAAGDTHEVYLFKGNEEVIHFTQAGRLLEVDVALTDEHNRVRGWQGPHVIIKTPKLKVLRADAVQTVNGEKIVSPKKSGMLNYHLVTVKDLNQDRLQLELDNGSNVQLTGNTIGSLHAVTGKSPESEPRLLIMPNNSLQQADLDLQHRSHLILRDAAIPELRYQLSENAQVELSGASLAALRK